MALWYADEIGDVEAFIDFAQASYIAGYDSRHVPHDRLDAIEREARAVWEQNIGTTQYRLSEGEYVDL
jgi:hypothetical protein